MSPFIIGGIGIICFFILALLRIPLGFSFMLMAFLGTFLIKGVGAGLSILGTELYSHSSTYVLSAIALFTLMGQFAFHAGIGSDLFASAYKWLGRLPGGLAIATMFACTGFAACTGSTVASAATMSSVAYPEMDRFGYNQGLSTGVIATGGSLGILIPPSGVFIIYGFLTSTSIATLFVAGILPGIMLAILYSVLIYVRCKRNIELGPRGESFPWRDRFASLSGIWGMLALFVLIIGGMYTGIFAPSEAAAVGAAGALVICAVRRRLSLKAIRDSLRESARITCTILTIIVGAMMFNIFLSVSGFGVAMSKWIIGLPFSPIGLLAFILFIYIPLGAFMDALAMLMLTLPIFFPVVVSLGFDPVWYGVLMVVMLELGALTPPIGLNAFVVHGMTKVPLGDIFRGLTPFILVMIVGLAILVAFPQISLFIPGLTR